MFYKNNFTINIKQFATYRTKYNTPCEMNIKVNFLNPNWSYFVLHTVFYYVLAQKHFSMYEITNVHSLSMQSTCNVNLQVLQKI